MISRNIAYKLWILDINSSEYVKSSGEFESNYIKLNDKQISRVNIVATVINKYNAETYSSVLIDDGSSQILVKTWNENKKLLDKVDIGETILIIAKIRQDNGANTLFLQPEVVKKVDHNWKVVRAHELEVEYGKPDIKREKITEKAMEIKETKVSNVSLRNKILDTIENSKEGITKEELSVSLKNNNLSSEIEELIKEGQIFEVKGKYRLLK
jgi:RPA family protein